MKLCRLVKYCLATIGSLCMGQTPKSSETLLQVWTLSEETLKVSTYAFEESDEHLKPNKIVLYQLDKKVGVAQLHETVSAIIAEAIADEKKSRGLGPLM